MDYKTRTTITLWSILIGFSTYLFAYPNILLVKIFFFPGLFLILVYQLFNGLMNTLTLATLAIISIYAFMYESVEYKIGMGCILGAAVLYKLYIENSSLVKSSVVGGINKVTKYLKK